jgi:hypothetical protein
MLKSFLATLTLGLMMNTAHAEYTTLDWEVEGDEAAFFDTDSGLEWLTLPETANMSISEVAAELGEGGLFEGWRLATAFEVTSLTESLTGYAETGSVTSQTRYSKVESVHRDFSSWFGWVKETSSGSSWNVKYNFTSYGLYLDGDDTLMAGVRHYHDPKSTTTIHYSSYAYNQYDNANYSVDYVDDDYGVFLVGDGTATLTMRNAIAAQVPVNGAGLALLSFMALGFRKKKSR